MQYPLRKSDFYISQGFTAGHQAIDLAANSGVPIYSPDTGIVVGVNNNPNSYFGGNHIKVKGISGYTFYMGHNSKNYFKVGDAVTEGQHIADVGSTGQATGPHVHFEMIGPTGNVDARKYLKDYPKGDIDMIPDDLHLNALYRAFRGREATAQEKKQFIGTTTYNQIIEALDSGPERKVTIDTLNIGKWSVKDNWQNQIYQLEDKNKQLEKELAQKPTSGGFTDKDRETAQDTNAIVKWIKNLLDRIFK